MKALDSARWLILLKTETFGEKAKRLLSSVALSSISFAWLIVIFQALERCITRTSRQDFAEHDRFA